MPRMLGVWMNINNPSRTTSQDLNLTVGGTILLSEADVRKLVKGDLFKVDIRVFDDDSITADDQLKADNSFSVGVHDTNPKCFHVGVIVPHGKLNDCESFWDDWAEVYCRVFAKTSNLQTNAANSQTEKVRID